MRYILAITFLLVPFGFLSPGIIHNGHRIAFFISALIILAIQIKNRMIRYFMLYAAAWTLVVSFFYMTGAIPQGLHARAISQMFTIICGGIVYLAVTKSKLSLNFLFNIICISAILQMIEGACQVFNFDPAFWLLSKVVRIEYKAQTQFIGTLGNLNFFAAYLAIALPFFLRRKWWVFALPIPYFIFGAQTSAAMIAAIVGLAYFAYQEPRCKEFLKNPWHRVGLIVLTLLVASMWLYYDGQIGGTSKLDLSGRLDIWTAALSQISQSWITVIFGLGPGSSWGGHGTLHNEWLTVFHRFGLIGLSFVLIYTAKAYRGNRHLFTAFIIICVNAIGNLPMQLAPSFFLILIIVGLMEREGIPHHGRFYDIQRTVRSR